jgi:hypothetical protein
VIGEYVAKLVNDNKNDWDEHLGVMLVVYCITHKVNIRHTPFQLLYGLYPLMPIEDLVSIVTRNGIIVKDVVKVFTNKISKLEKLEEIKLEVA